MAPSTMTGPNTDTDRLVQTESRGPQLGEGHALYHAMRRKYDDYFDVTYKQLGLASRKETAELQKWLDSIDPTDVEAIKDADKTYQSYYRQALTSAFALEQHYKQELRRGGNALSSTFRKQWEEKVHDEEKPYKEKEKLIRGELAEEVKVEMERSKLLRDKRITNPHAIRDKKLKNMVQFLRDDHLYFDVMTFTQRKNLVDKITASLAASEGGERYERLKKDAEEKLTEASASGWLHRDKIGTWLRRIFASGASLEQIEDFVHDSRSRLKDRSLDAVIRRWQKVAEDFWELKKDEALKGIDIDFPLTGTFLWMHYRERVRFVMNMKMLSERVRSEGRVRTDEERRMKPMKEQLEKQKSAGDINRQIQNLIEFIPSESAQKLVREALTEDSFDVLARLMYNLKWCHDHGYLDGERLARLEQSSVWNTQQVLQEGHRDVGFENLNLSTVDDAHKHEVVDRYGRVWASTLMHIDCTDGGSRRRLLNEMREKRHQSKTDPFGYWATLNIVNMPMEKQELLVTTLNWRIKGLAHRLKAMGFAFSPFGPPVGLN